MWPFKKHIHTLTESGMTVGMTDWHSHILPGVDDGIKDMEHSLEVLRQYEKLGIKKVWLTPHIMEDYPNTPSFLQQRFDELCLLWNGNVELKLASENMLDSLFEQRLEERDLLPIGDDGDHLLVETSYFNPPMNMDELIEGVFKAGYYPVLAHPERYRYMTEKDYRKYNDMGVLFQVNLLSTVGGYGESARKKSEWLLKNGYVDLVGSDLHRLDTVVRLMNHSPKKSETLEAIVELAKNPKLK